MYAVPQHQYSAALLGTKCIPFCSVCAHQLPADSALIQLHLCMVWLLKHVCSTLTPIQHSLVRKQCILCCSVLLCTPAASRFCLNPSTHVHGYCSSMYAVPQHQYSAALLGTVHFLLLSVAVHDSCQQISRSPNYTCAWLLFKHVCSTPTPIQCSLVEDIS
jgi:hypothetical protein